MAKNKTKYICDNCGYESSGWMGKCPSCSEWNTLKEEFTEPRGIEKTGHSVRLMGLDDIKSDDSVRLLRVHRDADP